MNKKILNYIAILLAALTLFALASCGEDNDSSDMTVTSSEISSVESDSKPIEGEIITENDVEDQTEDDAETSVVSEASDNDSKAQNVSETDKPSEEVYTHEMTVSADPEQGETIVSESEAGKTDNSAGAKQEDETSEPEEQDNEGELITPTGEIVLPTINP